MSASTLRGAVFMRIKSLRLVLVILLLMPACSETEQDSHRLINPYQKKSIFNSDWQKQGIGQEEWYYRTTVIDAPANAQALGIAEGHLLHPDLIRWEITKDMLIGWRVNASVVGADHEENPGVKHNYRGAPVVAFAILEHIDLGSEHSDLPWYDRANMRVDWSKNIVDKGISSSKLYTKLSHNVDSSWVGHPNRLRISDKAIDLSIRHPVEVSQASSEDSAVPVIDVRHSFIKKAPSDFEPLPMPDSLNKRMGFFRTNYDGRRLYDQDTGLVFNAINNATIFNIWQQSIDHRGRLIPIEQRTPKAIIYYTNLLHPDNLFAASYRAAQAWDMALREVVFYAQPGKYQSLDQVPTLYVLRPNSCQLDKIKSWFTKLGPEISDQVQVSARLRLTDVEHKLLSVRHIADYSQAQAVEISAKRSLEQICSALEFYTESWPEPFIYQRAGDLRFNLINAVVDNNTTKWSGYGPMFSDPISGETISATANVNLKYIDLKAQKISQQIALLNAKSPGMLAIFSSASVSAEIKTSTQERLLANDFAPNYEPEVRAERIWGPAGSGFSEQEDRLLKSLESKSVPAGLGPALMDPVSLIDDIALGLAVKFAHVSEHERFLKIREAIYLAVLQHELGHNIGLRHNMAGSSDALNYGSRFWFIEQLPADLKAARYLLSDATLVKELDECVADSNQLNLKLSTQDCLQQKNGMYSSIMDYHATALANLQGLGLYDKAALKLAYGHIIEVFPKANLMINDAKIDLKKWLRLNNYRHIPKALLKNYAAINQRNHVKLSWDADGSMLNIPNNAVPYAYCEDASGKQGPTCLSYDFGPDMKSSAAWLKSRYWTQYLLNHGDQVKSVALDIDILDRFSHMMRWFYYYTTNDPDFSSSYAGKDYLQAVAMGLNHFAQVIATPEPGAHVSAPSWSLEQSRSYVDTKDRMSPAKLLVPMADLDECDARTITKSSDQGQLKGRLSYQFVDVPLGLGRPYYSGFEHDLEESHVIYSGSALVKKYALYRLIAPMLSPAISNIDRPDMVGMGWYDIFPDAVIKILSSVINHRYDQLGPLVDEKSHISQRDIINESTLEIINYKDQPSIIPALGEDLSQFALANTIAYLPSAIDQVFCKGCRDDIDFGSELADKVISYTHLSGYTYQSAQSAAIGSDFLLQASQQKDRYLKLKHCIDDENTRNTDPFCMCVSTVERKDYDDWICCEEGTSCNGPRLKPVGSAQCSMADLARRKNQAKDQLDAMVSVIDEFRMLVKKAETSK